jgi:hypothetical protein
MYNDISSNPALTDTTVCGNTPDQLYGDWIDGGGTCVAYSCEDNNGDGIPDKCTNPGGNTILVPEDYASIQDAINVAAHGDEIIIGPGTYTGVGDWVVNPMGKRLWIHSSDGPEVTIIDGEGARRGIQCTGGETSETIFEGLTITRGFAVYYGGGMHNYSSSPTLTNCTFESNFAEVGGGGMHNSSSNPTLTYCTFTGNTTAIRGGGVYNSSSSPTLTSCTFTGNHTFGSLDSGSGGGMANYYISNPTLTDCIFTGNTADDGGGMYVYYSSPTLTGTTVCGNTPDQIYGDWDDNGGNTVEDECPIDCPPDINGDGIVNVNDILILIGNWGSNSEIGDVNFDGIVDVTDLLIVVGNWGPCE